MVEEKIISNQKQKVDDDNKIMEMNSVHTGTIINDSKTRVEEIPNNKEIEHINEILNKKSDQHNETVTQPIAETIECLSLIHI